MTLFLSFLGGALVSTIGLLFLWRRRVVLQSAQAALVIRRGTPSRIVFGDFVLMPFFERMEIISLQEQQYSFSFADYEAFHTGNGQKINIDIDVRLLPPKERKRLKQLLDEKGKEVFSQEEKMKAILLPLMQKILPEVLLEREGQAWINQHRGEIEDRIRKKLQHSSIGFEVQSVVVSKIRSTDLEFYNAQNTEDKRGLLSYQQEIDTLEEVERGRTLVAERKAMLEIEKKELQHLQLEVQNESTRLDKEHQRFTEHLEHIRHEIRVQIDLLKSHLDVELSNYRRQAAQESALLGKTSPVSVERESSKLRNRHRIDADMLKRKHEENIDEIAAHVESNKNSQEE